MANPIYLIGSLRNPEIPLLAQYLRQLGYNIFDDWYAAGPEADDIWKTYEIQRGRDYPQALKSHHADEVFGFDKKHLDRSQGCILVLPAGKSCHLEFGYMIGKGRWGIILLDSPDRWDIMYRFATGIVYTREELVNSIEMVKTDD